MVDDIETEDTDTGVPPILEDDITGETPTAGPLPGPTLEDRFNSLEATVTGLPESIRRDFQGYSDRQVQGAVKQIEQQVGQRLTSFESQNNERLELEQAITELGEEITPAAATRIRTVVSKRGQQPVPDGSPQPQPTAPVEQQKAGVTYEDVLYNMLPQAGISPDDPRLNWGQNGQSVEAALSGFMASVDAIKATAKRQTSTPNGNAQPGQQPQPTSAQQSTVPVDTGGGRGRGATARDQMDSYSRGELGWTNLSPEAKALVDPNFTPNASSL